MTALIAFKFINRHAFKPSYRIEFQILYHRSQNIEKGFVSYLAKAPAVAWNEVLVNSGSESQLMREEETQTRPIGNHNKGDEEEQEKRKGRPIELNDGTAKSRACNE